MSTNFNLYSKYYDLLYADKNYKAEVQYIEKLIADFSDSRCSSLLELGCGTGIHACELATHGMTVKGVDLSQEMLASAKSRAAGRNIDPDCISFESGDARSFRADRKFDAVASLFHVLSYQTTDSDVNAMMQTASFHLESKGIFIFDFWYGPAVLWQQPSLRVKRLANAEVEVTRIAEPVINNEYSTVDVNYTMFINNLKSREIQEIRETHRMRYFLQPEIDRLLDANGFDRLLAEEWLTSKPLSLDSWGVCVVARKR